MTEFNERYASRPFARLIHKAIELLHPKLYLYDLKIRVENDLIVYPRPLMDLSRLFDVAILGKSIEEADENIHSLKELQELFKTHKFPFTFKWTEGSDEITFTLEYNPENTDNWVTGMGYLERYLEDMRYIGEFDWRKICSWSEGITLLYNAIYWPFFKDHPDHIYTVDEINDIFLVHRIKYYIMKNSLFSKGDCGMIDVYSVSRVAWSKETKMEE